MSTNYTVFTNLKATGAFAAEGTLAVTGNATIGGNLSVTGALAPGVVKHRTGGMLPLGRRAGRRLRFTHCQKTLLS